MTDEGAITRVGTYAGLLSRGIALWIDSLVAMGLVAIATAVVRSLLGAVGVPATTMDDRTGPLVLALGSGLLTLCYYTAGFTLFGRTVGKLILGLRVVRADGRNPTVRQSALRTVGYLLSSVFLLGFLWAGIDRRHQAWHDKLAGTFVVYAWAARPGARLVPRADALLPSDRTAEPDSP
jgi:uncharacterized RDD family membrane protein YckC